MISIIIPSRDSEKFIAKNIESILKQDFKGKREIIVADSSTDRTQEILAKYPVKVVKHNIKGASAARNIGVKHSRGEILVFVDADCVAPEAWLKNLVAPFEDKDVAAVAGTYRNLNHKNPIANFLQYEIEQRHEEMKKAENIDFVGSYNCAYRRKVFEEMGGFNEKMIQAEDPDLSFRVAAKYKIKFAPAAYVYHWHTGKLMSFMKQKFQRGYWKTRLYRKYKGKVLNNVYTPASLMPQTLLFAISIFSLALGIFDRTFFVFAALMMIFSYALNFRLIKFTWKKDRGLILPSIALIFLRNVSACLGLAWGSKNLLMQQNKKI